MQSIKIRLSFLVLVVLLAGCDGGPPLTAERYEQSDALFSRIETNVESADSLQKVLSIDHSRLGVEAGSEMPPARVLIFSDPILELGLIQQNPLLAIDLPLRVLAYESEPGGQGKIIYNSYEYLESRYDLGSLADLKDRFNQSMSLVLDGIGPEHIAAFEQNTMKPDGITTIVSPYDFETTIEKIWAAINSQDDTVSFGSVDFQEKARVAGVEIKPATLILFGGPGPGAKAMSKSPTLGLDAFCQKFLVWQDESNQVHLSFNNLLALAERQDVKKAAALRVINFRLSKVFSEALD